MTTHLDLFAVGEELRNVEGESVDPYGLANAGIESVAITPADDPAWIYDWAKVLAGVRVTLEVAAVPRVAASAHLQPPLNYLGPRPDDFVVAGAEAAGMKRIADASGLASAREWATIDVLDVELWELSGDLDAILNYDDFRPGRLGWFERVCQAWATRLLILRADVEQHPMVRLLGGRLAQRGGPMVVVSSYGWDGAWPLVEALLSGRSTADAEVPYSGIAVIAGQGREALLRVAPPPRAPLPPDRCQRVPPRNQPPCAA